MSTDPDKQSFSLKPTQAGKSDLDILGGPRLHLGGRDKKRLKSTAETLSLSPLSEYGPPPNPSSDHLIAANPFDDDYNSPSLKRLPPAVNLYLGLSNNPAFMNYDPRMAPFRTLVPLGHRFQIQNQAFVQNQFLSGTQRFFHVHPESPRYGLPVSDGNSDKSSPDFTPEANPGSDSAPQLNKVKTQTLKQAANKNAVHKRHRNKEWNQNVTREDIAVLRIGCFGDGLERGSVSFSRSKLPNVDRSCKRIISARENRSRTSSSSESGYNCGICLSGVDDDQEAIMCEALCQRWFHRVCTGMTETAFNLLTAEMSAVWGCDGCMEVDGAVVKSKVDE